MSTPRILIVDDEPSNIQVLIAILQRDYTLTVANSGAKALQMAVKTPQPNLILLDIMMPDITGYEVCQRLKENPVTQAIPIIFVTALAEIGNEARGFDLGAVDYIAKPISPAIVRARVKSHIRIERLTHQLQQQNESLKAALQMRQDLAHMIVHDLRNPLASILLGCSLLKLKGQNLDEYQTQKVDQISSEAKTIDGLIDSILVTAKLETDKLLLHYEDVSLNTLGESVMQRFQDIANHRQISLFGEWADPDLIVSVDQSLMRRVFENLISNALKFSPTGSCIYLKTGYNEENDLIFQITDEGSGVPADKRDAIFEKYETAKVLEQAPQLGLGLAFCKMVVQSHGGRIEVEDHLPQGAIFTIVLPRCATSDPVES
ncbi:MAG: hybrid sensor histidine kinase/response regulator [Prochlorotrichaceae cyanobacterium]|jgi:signal transduction histidine kinase